MPLDNSHETQEWRNPWTFMCGRSASLMYFSTLLRTSEWPIVTAVFFTRERQGEAVFASSLQRFQERFDRLIDTRKRAGLSQKEVAEAIGVSLVTYNRWENKPILPETAYPFLNLSRASWGINRLSVQQRREREHL